MTLIQQVRQKLPSCFWIISILVELTIPNFLATASPTVSDSENRTISQVNYDPPPNSAEVLTCFRDIPISPQPPSPPETESVEEHLPATRFFPDSENIFTGSDFQEVVTPLSSPLNPLIPLPQNGGEVIIWTDDTKIFSIQDGVKDDNGAFVEVPRKQNRSRSDSFGVLSQSSNCSHSTPGSR